MSNEQQKSASIRATLLSSLARLQQNDPDDEQLKKAVDSVLNVNTALQDDINRLRKQLDEARASNIRGAVHAPAGMQAYLENVEKLKKEGMCGNTLWQEGCVVSLETGVNFLGDSNIGNQLFVRRCYVFIMDAQATYCAKHPCTQVRAILGTPGVGKTCLGAVLVTVSLLDGNTVIFHQVTDVTTGSAQKFYRLKLGERALQACEEEAFQQDLNIPETMYVVDGGLPSQELVA